jgi:hypothetical protein
MSDQYYYARGTTPFGPFSATRLRELAEAGDLLLTDSVWKQGAQRRVPASRVKNLFAGGQAPSPPAAPGGAAPVTAALPPFPEGALPGTAAVGAQGPGATAGPAPGAPSDPPAGEGPAKAPPRRAPQQPARKKHVAGIRGAVLLGQDGVDVQFRKKCGQCGYEDACRSRAAIRIGSQRIPFFCPKCRKTRAVEFTGTS